MSAVNTAPDSKSTQIEVSPLRSWVISSVRRSSAYGLDAQGPLKRCPGELRALARSAQCFALELSMGRFSLKRNGTGTRIDSAKACSAFFFRLLADQY